MNNQLQRYEQSKVQTLRTKGLLTLRMGKTLILRFGGLVLGLELTTLKWARLVLRNPSLTLSDFRKVRLATLTSSLMAVTMAYPSLSVVGRQVELAPQPKMEEVFVRPAKRKALVFYRMPPIMPLPAYPPASDGCASLVQQQAEQDIPAFAQNVGLSLWPEPDYYSSESYEGLAAFYSDDIVANFCSNVSQLAWRWCQDTLDALNPFKVAGEQSLRSLNPSKQSFGTNNFYQPGITRCPSSELSKSQSPCLASACANSSTTDWIKSSIKNRIKF